MISLYDDYLKETIKSVAVIYIFRTACIFLTCVDVSMEGPNKMHTAPYLTLLDIHQVHL